MVAANGAGTLSRCAYAARICRAARYRRTPRAAHSARMKRTVTGCMEALGFESQLPLDLSCNGVHVGCAEAKNRQRPGGRGNEHPRVAALAEMLRGLHCLE